MSEQTTRWIDPRLIPPLAELLGRYDVPHDEGSLLWEAEKRRYWVYLAGPDESLPVERRWEVRARSQNGDDLGTIHRGQTARIALARLFQWFVDHERAADIPEHVRTEGAQAATAQVRGQASA